MGNRQVGRLRPIERIRCEAPEVAAPSEMVGHESFEAWNFLGSTLTADSMRAGRPVCVVEVDARACPLRQLLRGVLQYLPHEP